MNVAGGEMIFIEIIRLYLTPGPSPEWERGTLLKE
jgi:hypothetical protein